MRPGAAGRGWRGGITLVGAEPHRPYDRPPLSKDVLLGKSDSTVFDLDWDQLGVRLLPGRRATALEPGVLHTDAGELPYGRLVLATGAGPVRLPGAADERVLRTVDDSLALRGALTPGSRVVLVGAGWIGAETATAARQLGCEVTVLEAAAEPLAGALPAELTAPMERWYAEAGVDLRLGAKVAAVEPGGVLLADGGRVPADEVVVGIGARPATRWLAGSGIELDPAGAIVADATLRTSLPLVWAAGDCVSYPRPGSASGSTSSTGTTRCTPGGRRPARCSGLTPRTTRCRTSGPSSSDGWSSTPGGTRPATGCSGVARRTSRPGARSGCAREC